jgi:hypothetical protein
VFDTALAALALMLQQQPPLADNEDSDKKNDADGHGHNSGGDIGRQGQGRQGLQEALQLLLGLQRQLIAVDKPVVLDGQYNETSAGLLKKAVSTHTHTHPPSSSLLVLSYTHQHTHSSPPFIFGVSAPRTLVIAIQSSPSHPIHPHGCTASRRLAPPRTASP